MTLARLSVALCSEPAETNSIRPIFFEIAPLRAAEMETSPATSDLTFKRGEATLRIGTSRFFRFDLKRLAGAFRPHF